DAGHYMWLTTAIDQRHSGIAGTGVLVDREGNSGYSVQIGRYQTPDLDNYTIVEGLEIKNGIGEGDQAANIELCSKNATVRGNLIYSNGEGYGIRAHTGNSCQKANIYNNIVYGLQVGIYINEVLMPHDFVVANNTAYGCDTGIALYNCGRLMNNASIGNNTNWVVTQFYQSIGSSNAGASGDAVPGTTPIYTTPVNAFADIASSPLNLKLKPRSTLLNLADSSYLAGIFSNDATGSIRHFGPWDVGALEFGAYDIIAPTVSVGGILQNGRYNDDVQYTVTVNDDQDVSPAVEVKLNNVVVANTGTISAEGQNTLSVTATDWFGNSTTKSYSILLDFTPPVVSASLSSGARPASFFNNSDSGIVITAVEALSGLKHIYYTKNNTVPGYGSPTCDNGCFISDISPDVPVKFFAEDNAGNLSEVVSVLFTVKPEGTPVNEYSIGLLPSIPVVVSEVLPRNGFYTVKFNGAVNLSRIFPNDKFMAGDAEHSAWKIVSVDDIGDSICVKDTATIFRVLSAENTTQASVGRWFSSITNWKDARKGDLVTRNAIEKGVCYNDSVFVKDNPDYYSYITLDGVIADSSRYLWLTVAPGEQHTGIAGTGVRIDGHGSTNPVLTVKASYSIIDGLAIYGLTNSMYTKGIEVFNAQGVIIRNNMIYDSVRINSGAGIYVHEGDGAHNAKIINNIVYKMNVGIQSYETIDKRNLIFNNTVYDCNVGIASEGTSTLRRDSVINNISLGSNTNYSIGSGKYVATSCGGESETRTGITIKSMPDDVFVNVSAGAPIDLHLKSGSSCISQGTNLPGKV
ncbi:MAG: hypothetical protein JNL74_02340, partial [Fibrobacteres bacterium]|nr:hypothetical protein [Fibrobacterota bacterium]